MMKTSEIDPKGLIAEAYKIDGIKPEECRSIFLDWALSLPDGFDQHKAVQELVTGYANDAPDHPMSMVLKDGLVRFAAPRRRGGWRSRTRD